MIDKFKMLEMYHNQGRSAARRKIEYEISFAEWAALWIESGKLNLRGNRKGCFVMARNGDKGPYKIGNVRIISAEENHREQWKNKSDLSWSRLVGFKKGHKPWNKGVPHSAEVKQKISLSNKGKKCPYNSERARLMGKNNKGKNLSTETIEKIRKSHIGSTHSVETKLRMSIARKNYWDNKRRVPMDV